MLTFPHFEPHFPRAQWTLPQVLEHQARERAERPFLSWTDAGPALSYAQVNARVNQLAHGMAAFGIQRREHVGILLPNCLEFLFAWFALNKLGAVEVAISDAYKGSFLAHPLQLSQARTLITTATLAQRLLDIEDEIPIQTVVLVREPGADPATPAPAFRRIRLHRFEDLFAARDDNPPLVVSPQDPAAVLLTSGTTGPSKGLVMPHSQFYFFAEEDVQLMRLKPDHVYITGYFIDPNDRLPKPVGAGKSLPVNLIPVYFDADVQIEGVVQGAVNGRVPSKRMVGFLQIGPQGIPIAPEDFARLLQVNKGLGGSVDCLINIAESNQTMRINRVEVQPSRDAANKLVFVTAAKGAPVLPKDGSWTVVMHKQSDRGSVAIEWQRCVVDPARRTRPCDQ